MNSSEISVMQYYCVQIPKIKKIYSEIGEFLNVIVKITFWFHKVLVHNLDCFWCVINSFLAYLKITKDETIKNTDFNNYNYKKLNLNVLNR